MKVNDAALKLIKEFEGFRATTYADPVGVLTIGYGTTAAAGVGIVPTRGMTITEPAATMYLMRAVEKFAAKVEAGIKVPVNENQFGAMVSLAYNIGPGAFASSTLLRKLNAGDTAGAADEFLRWNKAGGDVLAGLTRRRQAERALFLKPVAATSGGFWAALIEALRGIITGGMPPSTTSSKSPPIGNHTTPPPPKK